MMLVRYQGQIAGFVGATRYHLAPHLTDLDPTDHDRRRVETVCEFALDVRALTGLEPGRLPGDHR